MGPSGRK